MVDEAHHWYSDATREVGRLELCLNAVGVALSASEREATTTQAVIADAQALIMGKGSLHLAVLSSICGF